MRNLKIGTVCAALVLTAACDLSGDFLFASETPVPAILDLGMIEPALITTPAEWEAAVIYGELGAPRSSARAGATFTFQGTGGPVCLLVDPETVTWNQAVAARNPTARYMWPDNVFDDGDIDISAGFAAYYNGSPGEEIGDFEVRYQDPLGNPVGVALDECIMASRFTSDLGHSGRGTPEYCTMSATLPGVNYLVVLETWSAPLDDDRLGFALLLADGPCEAQNPDDAVFTKAGVSLQSAEDFECLLQGESIDPDIAGDDYGPWVGIAEVPSRPGSVNFEQVFCSNTSLFDYCADEAGDLDCDADRCFCGDPQNTPTGGSF